MIATAFLSLAVLLAAFAALALCVSKSRASKNAPGSPGQDGKLTSHTSSRALVSARPSDSAVVDIGNPRDSIASESPHGPSSKFASRFTSKRASSTSIQSMQSENNNNSGEGMVSEAEGAESDNDRISEEEDRTLRAANTAAMSRRRSSEFDRDSLNNGDFVTGPAQEEDTGRAAAMAMRLMANLRSEHDERKRLQAIVEQTSKGPTASLASASASAAHANKSSGLPSLGGSASNSPALQRAMTAANYSSPGGSPFGSRSATLTSGGLRPLSQEFGLAFDASRPVAPSATLPSLRALKATTSFKVKYLPEPGPEAAMALPTSEPVDLRETLKDAKRKLRPVSKGEEEFSECTFMGDCQCANCR
eukprot:m.201643 g.201643  ORF g.201643 m.201643 type:complete len:363 (+) comp15508_c1_seq1:37-1125(+)